MPATSGLAFILKLGSQLPMILQDKAVEDVFPIGTDIEVAAEAVVTDCGRVPRMGRSCPGCTFDKTILGYRSIVHDDQSCSSQHVSLKNSILLWGGVSMSLAVSVLDSQLTRRLMQVCVAIRL